MTEAEWLEQTEPRAMAEFLCVQQRVNRNKSGRRKLRRFGCGCCRRVWQHFENDATNAAVIETAEQFADDRVSIAELSAKVEASQIEAQKLSLFDTRHGFVTCARGVAGKNAFEAGPVVASILAYDHAKYPHQNGSDLNKQVLAEEQDQQAQFLRCIFGNPFRPVAVDPEWRTSTVLQLARGIYDDRAFDRLPILADALQDAGCDNADVLNHCRDAGPHARGCWVVDLVLGKS